MAHVTKAWAFSYAIILHMSSIEELNAAAWDEEVSRHNWWTIPADEEKMAEARKGHPEISLGPEKKLPDSWTGLIGKRVLALASGGGQQGPILAASGRDVVVFDISQRQLEQDRAAARKYSLRLETVRGDMADLSVFGSASFDTVINPVSLNFTAHIAQVISEVVRVLKPGGHFMLSIANPVMYIFDVPALERGKMK